MTYSYPEGEYYVFMDSQTFDQVRLTAEQLGENKFYLLDSLPVSILFYDGTPIGVTPPIFIELQIVETEPGFNGDTSGNVQKPCIMSTGTPTRAIRLSLSKSSRVSMLPGMSKAVPSSTRASAEAIADSRISPNGVTESAARWTATNVPIDQP